MMVFYTHLSWFFFLLSGLVMSFLASLFILYSNESIHLSVNFFDISNVPFSLSFYLDWMSITFMTVVLLISTVIMVYSYNYMSPYSKAPYFLWMTVLFIVSMLFVVTMSNLFFLMLGWDGLGLVSFFLIVYYQNSSSIFSGMFTLLMNRIGDCFFLVTISMFFYNYSFLFSTSSHVSTTLVASFMMITFMTKSAIYPFSPWLPLAMAAPTPISALVHSSTLVTAGLYLMMRYSYLLYSSYICMKALLILSLFTSFYAGMNAIFETDLKKLIALSTLSHLGFIGMAFSVGLIQLAFFHLLAHALFKSLLFMTMGDIMINLNHSQDIRYLSSGMLYTPSSCMVMYVSLFNLLGLPNLSGFFSKDLVLEMMNFSHVSSVGVMFMYINIFFTYFYTYQLFYYSFQPNKVLPYQNLHSLAPLHTLLMVFMGLMTLCYGFYFIKSIFWSVVFYPMPPILKFYPPVLMSLMFLSLLLFKAQFRFRSAVTHFYFSNMMFLSNFMMTLCSNFYYSALFPLVRSTELGGLNYVANSYMSGVSLHTSSIVTALTLLSPMKIVLYASVVLFTLFILFS